jgi:hypothetical protein
MAHWTEVTEERRVAAEVKFLVAFDEAAAIREWARARLKADPFGQGPFGDTYRTTSLYFDTAAADVFYRRGSYGRSKYRIRRYGSSETIFLERKLKKQDLVSKRRSIVALDELPRLAANEPEPHWPGFWFHRRVLARELHPVCRISYRRMALLGSNVRLTLDDDLRVEPESRFVWSAPGGAPILEGRAILEMKFENRDTCMSDTRAGRPAPLEPPPVLRELMETFALIAEPVSKYRLAVPVMAERDLHASAA